MLINCAIGERGVAHAVDDQLISLIHIADIACGGHAGDKNSINYYKDLSKKHDVKCAAYLSYANENTQVSHEELISSLEEQAAAFGPMECVKFQGDLYFHLNRSVELAEQVVNWLRKMGVKEVIAPYRSMLHKLCTENSIRTIYEAFADKKYTSMNVGLELMSRSQIGSTLENIDDIVRQVRKIRQGVVVINDQNHPIEAETICVDSTSEHAIETVKALLKIL